MEINQIREEFAEKITKLDPLGGRLKFVMDGQFMHIDGNGSENTMTDLDEEADCTITMSLDTYIKLQEKKIKPLIATLKGLLKVKGDLKLARKLKELM